MSPVELPVVASAAVPTTEAGTVQDASWQRTAGRARSLSWLSLAWMTVEGVVGLTAGLDANALSVIVWASSSFVEGLASMIVIWRFTGSRTMSASSERTAQRLAAGSFLLLVPFFVYEAIHRLLVGSNTKFRLRLGKRLGSGATAASAGLSLLDPIAALLIAATAARESVGLWRGDGDGCCAPVGFEALDTEECCGDCC
jgi:hypothetical protein